MVNSTVCICWYCFIYLRFTFLYSTGSIWLTGPSPIESRFSALYISIKLLSMFLNFRNSISWRLRSLRYHVSSSRLISQNINIFVIKEPILMNINKSFLITQLIEDFFLLNTNPRAFIYTYLIYGPFTLCCFKNSCVIYFLRIVYF